MRFSRSAYYVADAVSLASGLFPAFSHDPQLSEAINSPIAGCTPSTPPRPRGNHTLPLAGAESIACIHGHISAFRTANSQLVNVYSPTHSIEFVKHISCRRRELRHMDKERVKRGSFHFVEVEHPLICV